MNLGSFKNIISKMYLQIIYIAQSAGAVEYTDCISAEGFDSTNECPR